MSYHPLSLVRRQNVFTRLTHAVALVGLIAAVETAKADWTARESNAESFLTAVAHGNGSYVAVGEEGVVALSSDATNWVAETTGSGQTLRDVVFAENLFVAVGKDGTIVTSADGRNWVARDSGTTAFLSGVAYGNGSFVAAGAFGAVVHSHDGVQWTAIPPVTASFLQNVAFGNGTFVAVGSRGTIRTSADGISWQLAESGVEQYLMDVAHFAGRFYVVGQLGTGLSSSDAVSWAPVDMGTTRRLRTVGTNGIEILAAGDNGVIVGSLDGDNWSVRASGVNVSLDGLIHKGGTIVIVGEPLATSQNGLVLTGSSEVSRDSDSDHLWDDWEIANFGSADAFDGNSDPEGDGIRNIIEFLLDLDPNVDDAGSSRLPRIEALAGAGPGPVVITWTRHRERSSAESNLGGLEVEYSDSLAAESWLALGMPVEVLSAEGELETVRAIDSDAPGPAAQDRFYRLFFAQP